MAQLQGLSKRCFQGGSSNSIGVPSSVSGSVSDVGRLPTHIPRPKTARASSKQELIGTVWQAFSAKDTLEAREFSYSFYLVPDSAECLYAIPQFLLSSCAVNNSLWRFGLGGVGSVF